MKKIKIVLSIVLVVALFSALSISAFAYSEPASNLGLASMAASTYDFTYQGTTYSIPHGTVCSQTQNNTIYEYVYPIQFVLKDFDDYHQNVNHWYDPGSLDGLFGPQTATAVRHFQTARGLTSDGAVGDNTWAALKSWWG